MVTYNLHQQGPAEQALHRAGGVHSTADGALLLISDLGDSHRVGLVLMVLNGCYFFIVS